MLDLRSITGFLVSNWRKTGNPLGVPASKLTSWANKVGGESPGPKVLLYPGLLYQLTPYMEGLTSLADKIEGSPLSKLIGLGAGLGGALGRLVYSKQLESKVEKALVGAATLLRESGFNPVVLREEPYSGVLFYDLGLTEEFREQAELVARRIEDTGVELVVTIDPHTNFVLRKVYPRMVSLNVEVKHILEVLDLDRLSASKLKSSLQTEGAPVIHDPCFLVKTGRLDLKLREYLNTLGLEFREPVLSRERTFCCGGPVESIAPKLSKVISCRRVSQLLEKSSICLTACPICMVNLSRGCGDSKLRVVDYLELAGDTLGH